MAFRPGQATPYGQLAALLSELGLGWVVAEVDEVLRLGQHDAEPHGEPTTTPVQPYSAAESVRLLRDAVIRAVVEPTVLADEIALVSEATDIAASRVQFASDLEEPVSLERFRVSKKQRDRVVRLLDRYVEVSGE